MNSLTGVPQLLLSIVAILIAGKALGALAVRLRQPEFVGEILAGVLLGASVLGVVNPQGPIIHALSQAGVLVLLFAAGLHTEPSALVRAGRPAAVVAVAGVVIPFMLGYFVMRWFGATWVEALIVGAALCATSAEISARVLGNLGRLQSTEGRIVNGAAVIDDVIGLAILATVMSLVTSGSLTMESLVQTALLPTAFLAGLMIDSAGANGRVERITKVLSVILVPFFFAVTGALVNLHAIGSPRALGIAAALIACGIFGKVAAGWAPVWIKADKVLIGVAMVPRGEMGLIFAQMGLTAGALEQGTYGAIILMVLATTLMTPPALTAVARRQPTSSTPLSASPPRSTTP